MRQKKSSRRQARELAFQALYRLAFVTDPDEAAFRRAFEALPRAEGRRRLSSQAEGFAWELAAGAWRERERLDDILGRFSQNWKVVRMARIDLALLRLGLFELLRRPDVPLKVAINEAVELAKTYGDGKTPGFVNGILDAAARAVEKGELQRQALTAQAAYPAAPESPPPSAESETEASTDSKLDLEDVRAELVDALMKMPDKDDTPGYRINMGIAAFLGHALAQHYIAQEGFRVPARLTRPELNAVLKLDPGQLQNHLGNAPTAVNGFLRANAGGMRLKIGTDAAAIEAHGRIWPL